MLVLQFKRKAVLTNKVRAGVLQAKITRVREIRIVKGQRLGPLKLPVKLVNSKIWCLNTVRN